MTHKIQELMDGTRFRSLWSDHIQDSGAYGRIRELMDEIQDLMEKSYTLSRVPRLKRCVIVTKVVCCIVHINMIYNA